jgi:tetratricopeptide (TPR) repeat protein
LKKQDEIMLGMTLNNLAVCLEESGFTAESLEFYERSLKIKSEIFGEKSKEAAIGHTNLGYTFLCLDKSESGAEHCDRARQIALDLGINTSNQRIWTAILCNYAHGLRRLGRVDEAEKTQLEAAATREKVKDPQVHESYQELGLIYLEKRELDKAKNYFEKALSIREKSYGKEHPRVGSTLSAYAKVLRLQNQNSRADEMENLAAKIESKRARI